MPKDEMFEKLKAQCEQKAEETKTRDRILALVISLIPGSFLVVYLSGFTQDLFGYGMGFKWTEESVSGHRGLVEFNIFGAIIPVLVFSFLIHFLVYKFLRKRTLRGLWSD